MVRGRSLIVLIAVLSVSLAVAAESASASYGLGTNCATESGVGNKIAFDPVRGTATADGIITYWGYGVAADIWPRRLVVLQRNADPAKWDVVSVSEPLFNSPSAFAATEARIKISAGQVIGGWASGPYVPTCTVASSSMLQLSIASLPAAGNTFNAAATANVTTSIFANVEPDADGDGFGDETQDRCNHNGSISDNCPTLVFTGTQKNTKTAFRLIMTSSIAAPVSAVGTARLSKRKTIKFSSKEYVSEPGALTTLRLNYPRSLRNALKKLSKKKSIKVKVVVTATGIVNNVEKVYNLKLRGTKPRRN